MSVDRRLVNLAVFLLILGAIPLAVGQGWLARTSISQACELWPLILVGIGLGLILRRTPLHFAGGLLVAATFGTILGALLAGGLSFTSFDCGSTPAATDPTILDEHGSFEDGTTEIVLHASCANLVVSPAAGAAWGVTVTGSVKYDAAEVADRIEGQEELVQAMGLDLSRPLWVCGSTGPGEEALILDAYAKLTAALPDLQLALIPRKPERFDEVAALIVQRGFACLRRSTGTPTLPAGVEEPRPVYLGDSMGELRKFYAVATVVFVGRSLVPLGGSDVMEVAGLAKPMLVGPHTANFAEAVDLLVHGGGCRRVASADELAEAAGELLRHPEQCARMGHAARATIVRRRGATAATAERILALLP